MENNHKSYNNNKIDGGSEQQSKTFDKRFQSVRRPPQGQFNKYRQMFDALTKRTSTKDKSNHNENNNNLNENLITSMPHNTYNTDISNRNNLNQNDVNHLISTTKLNLNSNKNNIIMNMPYTDDQKSNHIYKTNLFSSLNNTNMNANNYGNLYYTLDKMDNLEEYNHVSNKNSKIFEGISDETNKLLNNLCTNNKQIAEFFEKPSTSASTSPSKMNVYKAVPYHLTNDIDLTKNDIYEATYEDSIITTTTNSCSSTLNKYNNNMINSSPTSSSNSFSIYPTDNKKYDNYDNLNTYCKMTNNESNYFELDDVEFSDDSYEDGSFDEDEDEEESNVDYDGDEDDVTTSITDLTNVAVPPPKPIRTFEHDVYVNSKDSYHAQPAIVSNINYNNNNNNLASYLNNENTMYVPSNNFKRNDKTRSLFNKMLFGKESEHVYETLPSVKEPSPVNLIVENERNNRIVKETTYKKNINHGTNTSKINKKDKNNNIENNEKLVIIL